MASAPTLATPSVTGPLAPTPTRPLDHIPLFSSLDDAEQQALFASMQIESVGANECIFWMGDKGGTFYAISSGEVAVSVPNDDGEHVTLEVLGPGGFFGEISLLDGGNRTATVRTTKPTELYSLTRRDFHAFLRRRPEGAIRVLCVMGARQRETTRALRSVKNPNQVYDATRTSSWEKFSDIIAEVAAGPRFFAIHVVWFALWILINTAGPTWLHFDPFPFGFLTLAVSLEAIFLSIFVMISQNRQSVKDRMRTDLDYQVNLKAQTEIMSLHEKLDRISAKVLDEPKRQD